MASHKSVIEVDYASGKETTRWLSSVELKNIYPFMERGSKKFEGGDGSIFKLDGNAIKIIENVDILKFARYKRLTSERQRISLYYPKVWYYDMKQQRIIQVFKWIDGLNLKEYTQEQDRRAPIPESYYAKPLFMQASWRNNKEMVIKNIMWQICNQVKVLHHAGYAHCDIKLLNIMVEGDKATLIDHDRIKRINGKRENTEMAFANTFGYQPPEITSCWIQPNYAGYGVDIWALGITIISMINNGDLGQLSYRDTWERMMREGGGSSNATYNIYYQQWWNKCFGVSFQAHQALLVELYNGRKISTELYYLLNGMLSTNKRFRYNIDQILKDEWFRELREQSMDRGRVQANVGDISKQTNPQEIKLCIDGEIDGAFDGDIYDDEWEKCDDGERISWIWHTKSKWKYPYPPSPPSLPSAPEFVYFLPELS